MKPELDLTETTCSLKDHLDGPTVVGRPLQQKHMRPGVSVANVGGTCVPIDFTQSALAQHTDPAQRSTRSANGGALQTREIYAGSRGPYCGLKMQRKWLTAETPLQSTSNRAARLRKLRQRGWERISTAISWPVSRVDVLVVLRDQQHERLDPRKEKMKV